jgi:hypothetical protein
MSEEVLDPADLTRKLRALVAAIDSGHLEARPTAAAYLHGALAALEAVTANRPFKMPEQDF